MKENGHLAPQRVEARANVPIAQHVPDRGVAQLGKLDFLERVFRGGDLAPKQPPTQHRQVRLER